MNFNKCCTGDCLFYCAQCVKLKYSACLILLSIWCIAQQLYCTMCALLCIIYPTMHHSRDSCWSLQIPDHLTVHCAVCYTFSNVKFFCCVADQLCTLCSSLCIVWCTYCTVPPPDLHTHALVQFKSFKQGQELLWFLSFYPTETVPFLPHKRYVHSPAQSDLTRCSNHTSLPPREKVIGLFASMNSHPTVGSYDRKLFS